MQTLQIDGKKAKTLYPKSSPEFKEMLIDTFGEKFFQEKITDRVKTFEDACEVTGDDPIHSMFALGTSDEIAYKKLKVIVKALNEGTVLSFANSNQKKWYPWFEYSGSGFRFFATAYASSLTTSTGSRLCFHSEELAKYAGTQFIELYNQFLN